MNCGVIQKHASASELSQVTAAELMIAAYTIRSDEHGCAKYGAFDADLCICIRYSDNLKDPDIPKTGGSGKAITAWMIVLEKTGFVSLTCG